MKRTIYLMLCLLLMVPAVRGQKQTPKMNYQKTGAPLPPFLLEKTAGGTLTNTQLKKGVPVMLMIFSPQCDHCEHIIDSLKNMTDQFTNTQLVLVAEDRNKQFMKDFIKKTGIGAHPLFKNIGTERGNLIPYIYNNKILPQVNFYDGNYKLVHSFYGNSPLDSIRMFIR